MVFRCEKCGRKIKKKYYYSSGLCSKCYFGQKFKFPNTTTIIITGIIALLFVMFFANIISPFILFLLHSDMSFVVGNPKPMYFYDISPSCNQHAENIQSAIQYLSNETGIKFIRLQNPLALVVGGVSYNCTNQLHNEGASGEAETGAVGGSWLIIVWNNVKLLDTSRTTILHETLHVLGFDHNKNPTSIMYSYASSNVIESDLINFIKIVYVENPIVYLNIIPVNFFYEALFFFGILFYLGVRLLKK